MLQLMRERNFLIFWIGNLISAIGDQITMTAFPLLVLNMTGSPFMTGVALAIQGIPRAILMLLGGAVTDRLSPRKVMLWANVARLGMMLALGLLILADVATLNLVLVFALLFGIADAFYFPAATAIVPSLVSKDNLTPANSLNQMIHQFALIIGPIVAAAIIAGEFSGALTESDSVTARYADYRIGFGNAFVLDSLTFAIGILSLALIKTRSLTGGDEDDEDDGASLITQVISALKFVWSIPAMRLAFIALALLEFFFQSPVFIGLPALTNIRFEDGASAFGQMIAAYGVGAFLGGATGGMTKPLKDSLTIPITFLFFGWSSLAFAAVILYPPLWWAMAAFLTAGLTDGFVFVKFMAWLQTHTPEAKMGRVMAVLMVMQVGLLPIAHIVIGALLDLDVELVILVISITMAILSVLAALHPDARRMTKA